MMKKTDFLLMCSSRCDDVMMWLRQPFILLLKPESRMLEELDGTYAITPMCYLLDCI